MTANLVANDLTAVEHDFREVERALVEARRRERALTLGIILRSTGLFALAVGGAVFLVLGGLWLVWGEASPQAVVSSPELTAPDRATVGVAPLIQPPAGIRESAQARIEEHQAKAREQQPRPAEAPMTPAVFDYVIFAEISFGEDGSEQVTVGMRYPDPQSGPSEQWCYYKKPSNSGVDRSAALASKQKTDAPVLLPITPEMAQELGTTVEVLREAQRLCRFTS